MTPRCGCTYRLVSAIRRRRCDPPTVVLVVDQVPFVVPRVNLARAVAEHLTWCRTNGIAAPPEFGRLTSETQS